MRGLLLGAVLLLSAMPALADQETPLHAIAVAGEAQSWINPDYATIEIGVITQGPLVGDALSDNNARMSKVIGALRRLGIADGDIHTSNFDISPKYQKMEPGEYDEDALRPIVGYKVANKVTVTVTDMTKIARIVDTSVEAGANASGKIDFHVHHVGDYMDKVRSAAIENARHKAQVLTAAAHAELGAVLSITDNESNTSYNGRAGGTRDMDDMEMVVVTGSRIPTPVLPGQISISAQVTVLYATQ